MSFNGWIYVNQNSINFSDPSGFIPCAETQSARYCVLDSGGYIDMDHFKTTRDTAFRLIHGELQSQFGKHFGQISSLKGFLSDKLPKKSIFLYSQTYYTRLPLNGFQGDELGRIALGMIMDYNYGFEIAQGIDPRCDYKMPHWLGHCSSFSNEDLPSDYLAVVSEIKNKSLEELLMPNLLGAGQQSDNPPVEYWGSPGDAHRCANGYCPNTTPYNDQCTLKVYDPTTKTYNNRPWPSSLVVEPYGFGIYWGRSISDFHMLPPSNILLASQSRQVVQ